MNRTRGEEIVIVCRMAALVGVAALLAACPQTSPDPDESPVLQRDVAPPGAAPEPGAPAPQDTGWMVPPQAPSVLEPDSPAGPPPAAGTPQPPAS
jgi:hypothetical protein